MQHPLKILVIVDDCTNRHPNKQNQIDYEKSTPGWKSIFHGVANGGRTRDSRATICCDTTSPWPPWSSIAAYLYREKNGLARGGSRLTRTLHSYIFAVPSVPVAQWIERQPSKLVMMVRFHPGTPPKAAANAAVFVISECRIYIIQQTPCSSPTSRICISGNPTNIGPWLWR